MQTGPDSDALNIGTDAAPTRPARSWAADLGPGLASLGCDNDPSGIATYSLAGAYYGFDMLWACVLSYPSMVALDVVCTRVAAITGHGLTANMRAHYAPVFFYFAVARLVIANTLNISVDVLAMAVALQYFVHGPLPLLAALVGCGSIALQWFVPYARYARIVKWLIVPMFAYAGVLVIVDVPWHTAVLSALVPTVKWDEGFVMMLIAILGTTMSPYLLYAQAEQEALERHGARHAAYDGRSSHHFRRMRAQTMGRIALSSLLALCIMIAAAATLHNPHAPASAPSFAHASSSVEIGFALSPLAGGYADHLLALALFGSALLALPPLAGSAAQAVASSFDWPRGKRRDLLIASLLVALTALGTLMGVGLAIAHVDFVKALYWSAIVNGMTITPVLVLLVLLSAKREAVGEMVAHWTLRALCWLATLTTGGLVVAHFVLEVAARLTK